MRILAAIAALCFAGLALAQPIAVPVDLPWSGDLTIDARVYALRLSSTGAWSAIPTMNRPANLKVMNFGKGTAMVVFPAQTTKITVHALRLEACVSAPTFDCEQPIKVRFKPLAMPKVVNVGEQLALQLEASFPTFQGALTIGIAPLIVGLPPAPMPVPAPDTAPTPTPAPVPDPVPVPVPSPTPVPPPVDPCTIKMPLAIAQLVDARGAVWTVDGRIGTQFGFARDGEHVTDSGDYVVINGGVACQKDGAAWECWTGSAKASGGKWVGQSTPICP